MKQMRNLKILITFTLDIEISSISSLKCGGSILELYRFYFLFITASPLSHNGLAIKIIVIRRPHIGQEFVNLIFLQNFKNLGKSCNLDKKI